MWPPAAAVSACNSVIWGQMQQRQSLSLHEGPTRHDFTFFFFSSKLSRVKVCWSQSITLKHTHLNIFPASHGGERNIEMGIRNKTSKIQSSPASFYTVREFYTPFPSPAGTDFDGFPDDDATLFPTSSPEI